MYLNSPLNSFEFASAHHIIWSRTVWSPRHSVTSDTLYKSRIMIPYSKLTIITKRQMSVKHMRGPDLLEFIQLSTLYHKDFEKTLGLTTFEMHDPLEEEKFFRKLMYE